MFLRRLAVAGCMVVAATGCRKPDANELFAKGQEYLAQDLVAEATVQFRLAVQADPRRGDIRLALSDAYLRQRDGSNALREAAAAADLLADDVNAQVKAGSLLLLARRHEDARARAEKALAIAPRNVDALVLMGNALAGLKDFEGAIAEYQEALSLDPAGDRVLTGLGALQYARGETSEAEALFRKAVDAAPSSLPARMALANFLWAANRSAEAETVLKDAVAMAPADMSANRALGVFYLATGRPAAAEPYFKAVAAAASTDEAQLSLADYYLGLRRNEDARAILAPLAEKSRVSPAAQLRLAALEAANNNRPGAMTIVRRVLDASPKFTPARQLEMRLLLIDEKADLALAAARSLLADEPDTAAGAEARFVIGSIEAARDRTTEAVESFEEALRIEPRSLTTAFALAQMHLRLGNVDRVETYARQVLERQPAHPGARGLLIRVDLIKGDLAKAARALAALEKEFPNSPAVLSLTAAQHMAAGRLDAARVAYRKLLDVAPASLEGLEGLVGLDLRAGRTQEAVAMVDAALKRMSPRPGLLILAARAYFAAGNTTRTEELLRQAIEADPSRLAAYAALGQFYIGQKRLADARDQFRAVLERNPRSVGTSTMLGMLLESDGDVKGAEDQYVRTLAIDPEAAVAANNLAWIYVASNRNLDQALQLAQTAYKHLPEEPNVNDTLGWIQVKKANYAAAVRHLELSARLLSSDAATHYHLGMAYAGAGETQKAKAALQKALALGTAFDGADEARRTLEGLQRLPGEPKGRQIADFLD